MQNMLRDEKEGTFQLIPFHHGFFMSVEKEACADGRSFSTVNDEECAYEQTNERTNDHKRNYQPRDSKTAQGGW